MDLIGLIPSFGNLAFTVVAFIVALSIIVAVHEYGHYIVGRWSGIHAEVFSIGFGPVLWSRLDRRGTRWQIAALPFGGYVKFLGDANAASAQPDQATLSALTADERRHTMHGAPLWARAVTVAAGPVFNFILSIIVFAALFVSAGQPTETPTIGALKPLPQGAGELRAGDVILAVESIETPDMTALQEASEELAPQPAMTYRILREGRELTLPGPTLYPALATSVAPGSAAFDAGMRRGDVIVAADGAPIVGFADLQAAVKAAEGRSIALSVWRGGEVVELALTPRATDLPRPEGGFETRYLIGIGGDVFFEPALASVTPVEALGAAARQTWFVASSSVSGLYHMVIGSISSCNLRGPIGIAETSGAAASQGFYDFIWFIAVLSTAVGLLNLFPIPLLDGGHLVFYVWEWARGKPPSDKVLNVAMAIGLSVVVALMVFGLTNDLICP